MNLNVSKWENLTWLIILVPFESNVYNSLYSIGKNISARKEAHIKINKICLCLQTYPQDSFLRAIIWLFFCMWLILSGNFGMHMILPSKAWTKRMTIWVSTIRFLINWLQYRPILRLISFDYMYQYILLSDISHHFCMKMYYYLVIFGLK